MKAYKLIAVLFFVFGLTANAQTGLETGTQWGSGQDSIKAMTSYTLFKEFAKQKNYADALEHWTYCFDNCPKAGKGIYISGVSIVKWEISQAANKEERDEKVDKLMGVYDQRIKYYGTDKKYPAPYILSRKALDLKALKKDLASQKQAYEWLNASITELGPRADVKSLQHYMDLSFKFFSQDEISGETLIADYEMVQTKLEATVAGGGKYSEAAATVKAGLEVNFANSGAADCETLEKMYGAKLAETPNDEELLNKILNLFDKTDCTENDVYYTASESLHKINPSSSSAAGLAKMYLDRSDAPNAVKYFEEAIALEEDLVKKSQYQQTIAAILFSKNSDYVKARKYALQAAKSNPAYGAPYILIGQMYADAAQKQKIGSKDIENAAGYWAAVDMFNKAKRVDASVAAEANRLIKTYSNYFPTKETIFFEEGYTTGNTTTVGGWVGVSTTVRSRD